MVKNQSAPAKHPPLKAGYHEFALETLTAWQIRSLKNRYNLSDGHARDGLSEAELSAFYTEMMATTSPYETIDQPAAERALISCFLECAGENEAIGSNLTHHYQYSASVGIWVVGSALASMNATSVAVLHPSFDNIPQLLKRSGLEIIAISEPDEADNICLPNEASAIFLTIPNNPTGWSPTPRQLHQVASECARNGTSLIIDATFRFQSRAQQPIYSTLLSYSGLNFAVIEDTGKTWPLNDLKASFVSASNGNLGEAIAEISEEVLLNVSAPLLGAIREVIHRSTLVRDDGASALDDRRKTALANELALSKVVGKFGLMNRAKKGAFVAWIALPEHWNASQLARISEQAGVSILPGDAFLWNESQPPPFVRIALLRDPRYFHEGLKLLESVLTDVSKAWG